MKCKICGNYVRLRKDGTVAIHFKNPTTGYACCSASGVAPGHPDHPDPLIAPDVTWEQAGRGYIDWPEPDQTGAAD